MRWCSAVSCVALLAVFAQQGSADENVDWWKTMLVYQVYPRSFMDSNNDGVGDLQGITSKLDHLADLGVTAVWLSPIYPSPQVDFGYDISDFKNIDPQYGNLADFEALQKRCRELNLKLVLDMVPNHCSDKHEWFQLSVNKTEPYTNFFVWVDPKYENGTMKPPNNWRSAFSGSAWTWNEERKQYYLHQFAPEQPDFNLRDENVLKAIDDIYEFWAEKGVDGFRIDAAPFLIESQGLEDEPRSQLDVDEDDHAYLVHKYTRNLPESAELFKRWRIVVDKFSGNRVIMAEAYGSLQEVWNYYGTPEKPGAHFPFNFFLMTGLGAGSNAAAFKMIIDNWMKKMDDFYTPNWVIGNHDQKRVATRFGSEMVDTMNMVSLTLPGISTTYYGEEIGMQDTYITWEETLDPQAINAGRGKYLEKSRDPVRTPFQWTSGNAAGFSKNTSTWLPVNPNSWWLNLQEQKANKKSHYHVYKALTEARKEATLKKGGYDVSTCCSGNSSTDSVLIIKRMLQNEPTFFLVVNLGSKVTSVPKKQLTDESSLKVWIASRNSPLLPGDKIGEDVTLPAKAAVLLTTGGVRIASSASALIAPVFLLTVSLIGHLLRPQI